MSENPSAQSAGVRGVGKRVCTMRRVGSYFLAAFVSVPLHQAAAGSMPDIKVSAKNAVPECVTPGRLMPQPRASVSGRPRGDPIVPLSRVSLTSSPNQIRVLG